MALEGLAAAQARISEIEQLFPSATKQPASAATATTASDTTDFAALLANATGSTGATSAVATGTAAPSATAAQFLATALSQKGKPYVWGSSASPSDPSPASFDCSELTKWAAARVGVTIPDGASSQYLYLKEHGTTMTVDQALHTPGALLFHFNKEPTSRANLDGDHVAISVGDGVHTIEARGRKYGTNVFEATGARAGFFNFAGMIPGM